MHPVGGNVNSSGLDMDVFDEGILNMVLERARKLLPEQMETFDSLPRFEFGPCPKELENKFYTRAHFIESGTKIYYGQVSKSNMSDPAG